MEFDILYYVGKKSFLSYFKIGSESKNLNLAFHIEPNMMLVIDREAWTYCHVRFTASVYCFGYGVHQVATDSKVTDLHLALLVDQYIGGLYIPVDDLQLRLQVMQCLHYLYR